MAVMAAGTQNGAAQGWGWGGGYDRGYDPPPPRGYDPPPGSYDQPPQRPVYGQPAYGGPPQQPAYGSANPRCRDLEAQLTGGAAPNAGQEQLPRIENDMRQADAQYQRAQAEAEHSDCYEDMFLFGRSVRRSQHCLDLDRQVQSAKSTLAQLKVQRDAILRGSTPRGRREEIVAELARNRCGEQYVREHEAQRSRNGSIFSFFADEDAPSDEPPHSTSPFSGGASTYRTLCVRECDGFYFPISNATTESHFQQDEEKCRSQCAAPAELFYHHSDQDVDQMVSLSGRPYSQMPYAFRNRKVYIKGCSCNANEYSREEIAKSEEALKLSKRADAGTGRSNPSSDAAFARRITQAVQNAPGGQPGAGTPPPAAPEPAPQPTPAQ
jgi:hypothetical protein